MGLGVWAILPVIALVVWTVLSRADGIPKKEPESPESRSPRMRITVSAGAWVLMLYFGLQSLHAYTHFGWLARIYRDAGLDAVSAGLMVAIIVAGGIPGGFIAPQIVVRRWHVRSMLVGYGLISAVGYTGLLIAPTTLPWLWAICLAIGGFSFPSALALITARTRNPEITARASGFVQSGGYVFAALGPLAIGVVLERTGTWTMPLVGLIVLALAMAVVAFWASSSDSLDEEVLPADMDGKPVHPDGMRIRRCKNVPHDETGTGPVGGDSGGSAAARADHRR